MENIYHDAEMLNLFRRSHLKVGLTVRRLLKKIYKPFALFVFFWMLWFSQQVYALANVPHVAYIVH